MPTFAPERAPGVTALFDWASAEAQFQSTSYGRPPESEIYGRSLSGIRRLGAFAMGRRLAEVINSPEAAQARVEFFTSVDEGFGTDGELGGGLEVRDFDRRPIIGGRVMSKDLKTAISDMTASGLACAEETARKDHRFLPQLTRSVWDHENALIVDKMVRGETGYTMRIVVSPFPEEAAAESGDAFWRKIGYVPHLKRGFVQLYLANGRELITGSLSFDGSDKRALQALFAELGVAIPPGEMTDNWLKYAITGTMSEEKARELATTLADRAGDPRYTKNTNTAEVTKRYKLLMERVFSESYVHIGESLIRGRQTPGVRAVVLQLANRAHNFNERYAKSLYTMRANADRFTDDDSVVLHELLVYSTIEMMRALHLQEQALQQGYANVYVLPGLLQSADALSFQYMLGGFGADGALNGRVYSACGNEIELGGEGKDNEQRLGYSSTNPQDIYGGADRNQRLHEDQYGPLSFKCKLGHSNERRRGELLTACRIRSCPDGSVGCGSLKPHQSKKQLHTLPPHRVHELFAARKARQAKVESGMGRKALGLVA
jgi:hypothetical protein